MYWLYLLLAGCVEIFGVMMMKQLVLTKKKIFILALILCFSFSFILLSLAMQGISMGVAYAVWTGIGAAGGVVVGIIFFKESKSFAKIFFVSLIIVSSAGLKLFSA